MGVDRVKADEQHGKLLEQSGLGPIMKTFRTRPPDVGSSAHFSP